MLTLKYLLIAIGAALLAGALSILAYDVFRMIQRRRRVTGEVEDPSPDEATAPESRVRWSQAARIAALAMVPLLAGLSIFVIPSGFAGVRVSQFSGPLPGTLSSGVHMLVPLVEDVQLYTTRDSVYTTAAAADPAMKVEGLKVQAKEGLSLGLAVAVRYRLEPAKLYTIHTTLPADIGGEVVAPVVASAFRDLSTNYGVRELFANKREEVRSKAAETIRRQLSADGLVVKEVILRDVQLPAEYARGLEELLLKEQQNERLTVELQTKEKEVKVAQMEASSQKEITVKEAEAAAQAKVLDSRAELERLKMMAEAEENRIRRVAAANSEKLKLEAAVLKENPLLIQKIIAERLSDKVQIMMVPADVKNFFATDVLRGALGPQLGR